MQEAYRYIDVIKQKYNIKITEIDENGPFISCKNIIRIIGIKNKNIIEKDKWLFIELIT